MRLRIGTCGVVGVLVATAMLAMPASGLAVENCKVKVNAHDGALLVSAKAVGAGPRWGFTAVNIHDPLCERRTCRRRQERRSATAARRDRRRGSHRPTSAHST